MFTTFKVRANQPAGDYRDPGDYAQPAGTQAYEWQGAPAHTPRPARADTPGTVPGAATARKPAASGQQPAASSQQPAATNIEPGTRHENYQINSC